MPACTQQTRVTHPHTANTRHTSSNSKHALHVAPPAHLQVEDGGHTSSGQQRPFLRTTSAPPGANMAFNPNPNPAFLPDKTHTASQKPSRMAPQDAGASKPVDYKQATQGHRIQGQAGHGPAQAGPPPPPGAPAAAAGAPQATAVVVLPGQAAAAGPAESGSVAATPAEPGVARQTGVGGVSPPPPAAPHMVSATGAGGAPLADAAIKVAEVRAPAREGMGERHSDGKVGKGVCGGGREGGGNNLYVGGGTSNRTGACLALMPSDWLG